MSVSGILIAQKGYFKFWSSEDLSLRLGSSCKLSKGLGSLLFKLQAKPKGISEYNHHILILRYFCFHSQKGIMRIINWIQNWVLIIAKYTRIPQEISKYNQKRSGTSIPVYNTGTYWTAAIRRRIRCISAIRRQAYIIWEEIVKMKLTMTKILDIFSKNYTKINVKIIEFRTKKDAEPH